LKLTLKDITTIQTGIFAKTVADGEIIYLQARHFEEDGQLRHTLQPDLKPEFISNKHLLKDGDILFAAKGIKNFAALYKNENGAAVASTSFFVIRLQKEFQNKMLTEFLAWLINHPQSQKYLKNKAIGTSMVSISKSVLEELEVFIPTVKTQMTILQINDLRNKEKKLHLQIAMLREQLVQQQIINSIK